MLANIFRGGARCARPLRVTAPHAARALSTLEPIKFGADSSIPGFVAGAPDDPAVIVIQEWWGVNEGIKAHALKIAARGYRVLIPDIYKGKLGVSVEEAHHHMETLDFPKAVCLLILRNVLVHLVWLDISVYLRFHSCAGRRNHRGCGLPQGLWLAQGRCDRFLHGRRALHGRPLRLEGPNVRCALLRRQLWPNRHGGARGQARARPLRRSGQLVGLLRRGDGPEARGGADRSRPQRRQSLHLRQGRPCLHER